MDKKKRLGFSTVCSIEQDGLVTSNGELQIDGSGFNATGISTEKLKYSGAKEVRKSNGISPLFFKGCEAALAPSLCPVNLEERVK